MKMFPQNRPATDEPARSAGPLPGKSAQATRGPLGAARHVPVARVFAPGSAILSDPTAEAPRRGTGWRRRSGPGSGVAEDPEEKVVASAVDSTYLVRGPAWN